MRVPTEYGPAVVPSRIVTAPGAHDAGIGHHSWHSATARSTIPSPLKSPDARPCGGARVVRSVRVKTGAAAVVIGSHAVFDSSPPGTGFRTAMAAVFPVDSDAAGIVTRSSPAFTNVVASGVPLNDTAAPVAKFAPFTVSAVLPPP